jgi:hypothetical protein
MARSVEDVIAAEQRVDGGFSTPCDIVYETAMCLKHYCASEMLRNLCSQITVETDSNGNVRSLGTGVRPADRIERAEDWQTRPYSDNVREVLLKVRKGETILGELNRGIRPDDGVKDGEQTRPFRIGQHPMIGAALSPYGLIRGNKPTMSPAMSPVEAARYTVVNALRGTCKKFVWMSGFWYAFTLPAPEDVYELRLAVIRTKFGDTYEYLTVHWPEPITKLDKLFIKGKRWIDAFKLNKKDGKSALDLGEVVLLHYWKTRNQLSHKS